MRPWGCIHRALMCKRMVPHYNGGQAVNCGRNLPAPELTPNSGAGAIEITSSELAGGLSGCMRNRTAAAVREVC